MFTYLSVRLRLQLEDLRAARRSDFAYIYRYIEFPVELSYRLVLELPYSYILVYMPDHREKKSPSAKTVYMPVRTYAQPSGKNFAFGEKAIEKQHKIVIYDQQFQKNFAFGENRIYAQPYNIT